MIDAQLKVGKNLVFKISGDMPKAVWSAIAELEDVFAAETACGLCNGTDLRFAKRTIDGDDYFEMRCVTQNDKGYVCNAQFSMGQHKQGGGLFPKRKDKDGNWLPNRGWYKWQGKTAAQGASGSQRADEPEPPF